MAQKASAKYQHKCLWLLEKLCFFQGHSSFRHGTLSHISHKRVPRFMSDSFARCRIRYLDKLNRLGFASSGMMHKRLRQRELIA